MVPIISPSSFCLNTSVIDPVMPVAGKMTRITRNKIKLIAKVILWWASFEAPRVIES